MCNGSVVKAVQNKYFDLQYAHGNLGTFEIRSSMLTIGEVLGPYKYQNFNSQKGTIKKADTYVRKPLPAKFKEALFAAGAENIASVTVIDSFRLSYWFVLKREKFRNPHIGENRNKT